MNKVLLGPIIDVYIWSYAQILGAEKPGEGKREKQEDTEDLKAEENVIYWKA